MLRRNRRLIQNVLLSLTLVTFLTATSGCSSVKDLQIFKTEVKRAPLNLPEPAPIKMQNIQWVVVTPENAEQVYKELLKNRKDQVIIGLTDEGYETLAINFAQIRKYIVMQREVIKQYKNYYEKDVENGTKEVTKGK